jgi:hypothetical protein
MKALLLHAARIRVRKAPGGVCLVAYDGQNKNNRRPDAGIFLSLREWARVKRQSVKP